MHGVYVTIDFESVNTCGRWYCYSIMVSNYPKGDVLEIQTGGCTINDSEYDAATAAFWNRNRKAHDINRSDDNYKKLPPQEATILLCSRISKIMKEYPRVYFVTDNPGYDLTILNTILVQNGYNPVSNRDGDVYFQCICSWSFRLSTLAILGISRSKVNEYLRQHNIRHDRTVDIYFGPRHTPQADCARIMSQHFEILDIIHFVRNHQIG